MRGHASLTLSERSFAWGNYLSTLASALLLIAVVGLVGFEMRYDGRIYPGVRVAGISVGGMTPAEAAATLESQLPLFQETRVTLRLQDKVWETTLSELGARLDTQALVAQAYGVGRGGSVFADLQAQLTALRHGVAFPVRAAFDAAVARRYIERIAQEVDIPVQNAAIYLQGTTVHTVPSRVGLQVDVEAAVEAIRAQVMALNVSGPAGQGPILIELRLHETYPTLPDVSEAKAVVETILASPIVLTFKDQSWTIPVDALAGLIRFYREPVGAGQERLVVRLDEAGLANLVAPIGPEIYQIPQDARLDFDPVTRQISVLEPSRDGQTLDVAETVRRIQAQAPTANHTVPVAVRIEKPAVAVEDIPKMGIVELVSQATTYFKGSPPGRVKNIEIAASKFNGVVIPPGGIFSFNRYLGEVSAEQGYEESYIIFRDRTTVGLGGGICQVSTTAFRAAFWGGFPIVERWAHGYRVRWYDPPVGLDATVYAPSVDFKFLNDTGSYLLIETDVDRGEGTVTFTFYGTKPDRVVEMEGPIIENVTPPGPPVYEEDPTLPEGVVKQVDWAKEGADVTVYRIIKQGDKVTREEFVSHYKAWRDVFRVGKRQAEKTEGASPTQEPTPTAAEQQP